MPYASKVLVQNICVLDSFFILFVCSTQMLLSVLQPCMLLVV